MLIILLTWLFITMLVYPTGVWLHTLLRRLFHLQPGSEHGAIHCISGLMVTGFVSSALCLFMPLQLLSSIMLAVIAAAACIFNNRDTKAAIRADLARLRKGHWTVGLLLCSFVLVFSYISYLPSSHYDDGLYYSTTIKWLQEYGTVKGLANVNPRIGYNSSWHIVQANFGFPYLQAGLFNDLNGLLIIYIMLYSAGGINNLLKGDNRLYNCVRAFLVLPALLFHFTATSDVMLFNVNVLGSSAADIPACLLTWLIFLLFLQKKVNGEKQLSYADVLVVLYSAWNLSIKLSVVPVILLSVYIMYRLLAARRFRQAISLILLSMICVLPWLIRNIYVSGYLLFPFSPIDIFDVPWKLPIADVKWQENAVRAFALNADLGKPFDIPFATWFPAWLGKANFIQQASLGLVATATVFYVIIMARQMLAWNTIFFSRYGRDIVCMTTCLAGILFWLFKAPDFRFGYGFICFYCIYFVARLCRYFLEDVLHYLFVPVTLYMAALAIFYYSDRWMSARLIFGKPLAYRMPQTLLKSPLSGAIQMNIVLREDSWNAPLPVANEHEFKSLRPSPLGQSIAEGFKSNKKGN